MTAVTLGPSGTYSHRAATSVTDDVAFAESVTGIVEAVADGDYDRGVVPVENSIEGSVGETLDALVKYDVAVTREIVTPIRHALLGQGNGFETVASHPQALAQCREYLAEHHPDVERKAVASTAKGVELARRDDSVAAIAHPANAEDHDKPEIPLSVLAEDVQDRDSNATRFFVVAPIADRSTAGAKTSIVVYPNANYPGLLLELLQPFADNDVNLSRVESRPSGERLGDYLFHLDFAAGLYEDRAEHALEAVEAVAEDGWVKRLGSYDTETVL